VTAIGIGYILAEPTGGATVSPEEVSTWVLKTFRDDVPQ
jgi:hypothetical protein